MRILSLIASSTEIVCALGMGEFLVGRSHECDYPDWVKQLPQCTEPKINFQTDSAEIDRQIRYLAQEGLSVYRVFTEKLKALKPDIILTQIQCKVCAVSEEDVIAAATQLLHPKPQILSLHANTLEEVFQDIHSVASILGVPDRAEAFVSQLKLRLSHIKEKSKSLQLPPRVLFLEWIDPLLSCGHWIPELIEFAGGHCISGKAGGKAKWISLEEIHHLDPDLIIIAPCGYEVAKTADEMKLLELKPEWQKIRAVRNRQVHLLDGNQYFNRPGPRLVDSAEILGEIFLSRTEK